MRVYLITPTAEMVLRIIFYLYREWSNILPMQEKYLIHIRPPGDVIPDAFREIVRLQNATNAAILYDDSFGEMLIEM